MALSKLAVRRLTKLADYMDSLPKSAEKHFDMCQFFMHDGPLHSHGFGVVITRQDMTACGTVACALGWAATMPYFRKLGLFATPTGVLQGPYTKIFDDDDNGTRVFHHVFRGGLTKTIKTPKQWAKHCRKFIRENS